MKNLLPSFLLLILPAMLMSQDSKKALVIGIDGCRSDALQIAHTPYIDELIATGLFSPDALNDDITISGPGWSAILCGVWSEKHLVTGNDFSVDDYDTYPTFFKRAKDYDPEIQTVSICHWSPINNTIVGDQADFRLNVSSDAEVANQASDYLSVNDPDIMFLHFDEADGIGHGSGFSPQSPAYLSIIEEIDSLIGTVIHTIENRPNFDEEDWLIVLTTDHGGLGTSHGGNSIDEERVFVIASGKSVIPEVIVRDSSVSTIDVENCLNDTMELQFDGVNDRVEVPNSPQLNFGSDQDFTIECRARTSYTGDVAIVGNKDWESGLNKGFVFSFRFPSGPEWKVNLGDGNQRADINTGGEIADNDWHTLSVSFDRDGYMKMYQDGQFIDSANISFIDDISTNSGLFFGTDINSAFDYQGAISEVRVWDTILEHDNISQWFCSSVDNAHPQFSNLIGYWKLNEGSGNIIANDESVNANSGSIIDATWAVADTTLINYDYSNTPRITDVLPTVLNHLCIPIKQSWNLDGASLIQSCETSSLEKTTKQYKVNIYPNPAEDEIILELDKDHKNKNLRVETYDINGIKILESPLTGRQMRINVSHFVEGTYFVRIVENGEVLLTEKIFIQ